MVAKFELLTIGKSTADSHSRMAKLLEQAKR